MKVLTLFLGVILALLITTGARGIVADGTIQDIKKPPEVITLGADAKLGAIKFNHLDHITKNHSADGTKQIECVECHHTAQPAAEAAKHPPHKTAWPADRSTTLTAELLEKDPSVTVNLCTDCL